MRKILCTLAFILCSLTTNAQEELIDIKYNREFIYNYIAFDYNHDNKISVEDESYEFRGRFIVKYDDFDTAGNVMRIAISAPKQNGVKSYFTGLYEDVIYTREVIRDKNLIIYSAKDKFGDPIFDFIKGEENVLLFFQIESLTKKDYE